MHVRIAEEKINEIRQAVDIVDLISDYVQLKKQGRNYFGLCPFHGENTPSFSVSPDKQIFHCFGCGAGGNAFSFLMELESLSFQEAAIKLAERTHIELEISAPTFSKETSASKEFSKMIEAHELIRKFYHHLLVNTKDGQHALEYLLNRGFTLASIEKFQIGYALNSWDFVYKFLTKRNFEPELLERCGLIIKREKDETYFDRFRDRIMFPILDQKGNTIAFSGRSLGADEPKYLNSPETAIFNKSKILYNFHLARASIRKQQQVILFEGFADCIAAERAGVENGVATMGTSLTSEHIALIRRNAEAVTVCYDSDSAGIEAAYRAATMLAEAGSHVRVALMPDGLDPDDYIKKFGAEKFNKEIIGSSLTFMSFKLLYFRRGKDLQNEGDRLQYIEEVLMEISQLDKAVERDHYLRQLANEFSLSLEALKEQQRQLYFAGKKNNRQQSTQEPYKSFVPAKQIEPLKPAYYNAERSLIYYMMRDSGLAYQVQEKLLGHSFHIDEHQAIITYLFGYYEDGMEPNPSYFMDFLKDEKLRRVVANIEMMSMKEEVSDQELSDYINQVLKYQKMLKIKEKEKERQEAERKEDYLTAAKIAMEMIELRKSL
ncbi:DNA primase [Robertmurraya andreesenii]|uniref:DNA primase n=1 Tax=Anoxybacillus andreesenii TaxID=1325932 RepID=A0ABT9V5X0_9BACL|nr:DNA primase [Robertmurraya andreesenii]MDQ0156350.1 DNA primase [Robertmurraya andreesenii]